MRRFSLALLVGLASLAAAFPVAFAQVATDPVGFLTLNVQGTGGTSSSALSFLGLSFTQPVSYQATLSSASGTTLTDSNATWSDDQFNGANGQFYVELISGTGAGTQSNITATSGTNKTITTADDISSFVTAGTGYKIRKNWTIASVFGPNDESGLQGGSATSADQILVLNQATQQYTIYYYKTTAGGTGWRTTTDLFTDRSNTAFKPADGVIVKRLQSSNLSFSLAGAVKLGQTAIPIATNLNLVSNVYPSGNLTLGSSNLVTSGFTGGSATTGDQVLILNPANQQYTVYYYKTTAGGTGWRTTTDLFTDQSNVAIAGGQSLIIKRTQNRVAFTWIALQPF